MAGVRLRIWVVTVAGLLLALLLWGGADGRAQDYLAGAIADLGLIYGTARGINALVSVLQGTELDLPMLTLTLGELLDPVNDLIERFSGVMTFALGALILQQVLLAVLSDGAVTAVLALVVAGLGALSLRAGPGVNRQLLRLLLMTACIRLSLSVVVVLNGAVDARFLPSSDSEQHRQMIDFRSELEEMQSLVDRRGAPGAEVEEVQGQLESLDALLAEHRGSLARLEAEQADLEQAIDRICDKLPFWKRCNADNTGEAGLTGLVAGRERLEGQGEELEQLIRGFEERRAELARRQACLEQKSRGERCGLLDWFEQLEPGQLVASRLELLENRVSQFVDNALNLLISALLKAVIIPLLFLYGLVAVSRLLWRRLGRIGLRR